MAVSEDQNQRETNHPVDEKELEEYGVWVKAGPEDVIEADAEDESFTLDDLTEDELSEAETELLADEELSLEVPDALEMDVPDLADSTESLLDLGDDLEEISIDDTPSEQPVDIAELAISGDEGTGAEDDGLVELTLDDLPAESPEDDGLDALDLDLDDEMVMADEAESTSGSDLLTVEEDDLTLDGLSDSEELELDLPDELEIEPDAVQAAPDDDLADLGDELELEDLDLGPVAASAEPGEELSGDGIIDDNLNIDENLPDNLDDLTLNLDDLDVDSFEETEAASVAGVESPEDGEADILELGMEDDELDLSALPADDSGFGEISPEDLTQADEGELPELALDDDIADFGLDSEDSDTDDLLADLGTAAAMEAEETAAGASDARSINLLESIERELSSIRTELGDLKRELGELRSVPVREAPAAGSAEEDAAGGFFADSAEDDDETIALTGAELDNIMNTAEFTEETGEPTEVDDLIPAETDAGFDDEPVDILADDASVDLGGVDEISLDEPEDESEPLEIDLEGGSGDTFTGSPEEVEALASMDIDAELADIDELEDTTESMPEPPAAGLSDLDLGLPESDLESEVVLDAEPIDDDDFSPAPAEVAGIAPEPKERAAGSHDTIPDNLKAEMKTVLTYLDQLLEALPEDKITEFAQSDHFTTYQQLFKELGLEQ